jgi:hypothetical protein
MTLMSLLQPALEELSHGPPGSRTRDRSAIQLAMAIALAATLLALSAHALLRGPWLDEFWTLELSDPSRGLLRLSDGWLRDTHPPAFNVWATLLSSLGITSIPLARLASNLPAAGLMFWAAAEAVRRRHDDRSFHAAMLLLVLALPQSVQDFANYRSYFWQIAAIASLVAIARHVVMTKVDLELRRDRGLVIVAVLATAGSIALHYVGAIFGGLLAGAIILRALQRGHWRWAGLVFVTASIAALSVVAVALLQARNWAVDLDHSWIAPRPLAAVLAVPLALIAGAVVNNVVPLAALWPGWRRWNPSERIFVVLIAAVLAIGLLVVLAINAVQPIMVDRYLVAVPVLVAGILAALTARLDQGHALHLLLALVAVAMGAGPLLLQGAKPLWEEGARSIEQIVEACPTTRIYAASGWALGPAANTKAARREDPVFQRAYQALARTHGYTVRFLGQNEATAIRPGRCPVLVWYEHTPNDAEDDLRAAIEAAGLTGIEEAHLTAIRSPTGFVVRADAP